MMDDESIVAARRVPLDLAATDGSEYTGAAPTGSEVLISIQGGAWQQASGTVTKLRDGDFYYEAARAETRGRGMRLLRVAKSGMQTAIFEFQCGTRRASEADASARRIPIILEATNGTPLPGLDPDDFDVEVSVNGGAFVGGSGTAAEILDENDVGYGAYYYEPTRTEHARGHSLFNVNATGAVEYKYELVVDQAYLPTIANATTPKDIIGRIIAVIEALSPTSLGTLFRVYRDESPDFIEWCETKPTGALRRFQVTDNGSDGPPATSSGLEEEHMLTVRVTVAYPKNGRYGDDQGRDRKRVMREDQKSIERAIGMLGKANFTPPFPDATWQMDGSGADQQEGAACDFLQLTLRYSYLLDIS